MKSDALGTQLHQIVISAVTRLENTTDYEASERPASGKWSVKQVIGHLVDSAINNQYRFITAQSSENLIFTGYDQEFWVRSQKYNSYDWLELIQLWKSLNLHLAAIIDEIPTVVLNLQRRNHNLDKIAWKPVNSSIPTTLRYFILDYIGHLEHHLKQVFIGYQSHSQPYSSQ